MKKKTKQKKQEFKETFPKDLDDALYGYTHRP